MIDLCMIFNSGIIINLIASIVGVILGGIITWLVAKRYYMRATQDLKGEASELRRLSELILRGMENAGWVKLNRDKEDKITGFIFELSTKVNAKLKTSAVDLTVRNERND